MNRLDNLSGIKQFQYLSLILQWIYEGKDFGVIDLKLTGSRKSGKTQAVEDFILGTLVGKQKVRIECFRYMQKDKSELWKNIINAINEWNVSNHLHIIKDHIKYGQNILRTEGIYALDKTKNKIKGRSQPSCKYLIVWFEEFSEVDNEDDWLDIKMAMRSYTNVIWIRTSNPKIKSHWSVKEMLTEANPTKEKMKALGSMLWVNGVYTTKPITVLKNALLEQIKGISIVHFSNWRINHYLNEIAIKDFETMEKYHPFRAVVESFGMPGNFSGGILTNYLPYNIPTHTPSSLFNFGLDYGFKEDACVTILVGTDIGCQHLNVYNEFYHNNKLVFKDHFVLANDIITWIINQKIKYNINGITICYCDNSEQSFIAVLNKVCESKGANKHLYFTNCYKPPLEDRPQKWMTLLSEKRMHINPICTNLLREMSEWQWDISLRNEKPMPGNDHCLDALCYALTPNWGLFKTNLSIERK